MSAARGVWWVTGLAVAGLVIAGAVAGDRLSEDAAGQSASPIRLTAGQLAINQRISQAAVRRSNRGLTLLSPVQPGPGGAVAGWGRSQLAEDVREALPRWAVVAPDGSVTRARGATAAVRTAFGRYRVTFDRSVAACALSATLAVSDPSQMPLIDRVPTLGVDPAEPAVVTVRIFQASNPGNSEDAPFHLTVLC